MVLEAIELCCEVVELSTEVGASKEVLLDIGGVGGQGVSNQRRKL